MTGMTVVITGDPIDGFSIFGPFKTMEDGIEWAEDLKFDWWVAPLQAPRDSHD